MSRRGAAGAGNPVPAPPPPVDPVVLADVTARCARSQSIRTAWNADAAAAMPADTVGLALSGGGIRSATFALGLIQALAKADVLRKVDVLSTVSGGGYIGCFLRGLFLPQSRRGLTPQAQQPDREDVARRFQFAQSVLTAAPDQKEFAPAGVRLRHPLWWLREHSRYLAPNGALDYGYAVAYLSRNWLAMIYIFVLAVAGLMTLILVGESALATARPGWFGWTWHPWPSAAPPPGIAPEPPRYLPISPLFALAAIPLAFSAVANIGYWATQAMSANEADIPRQWGNLLFAIGSMIVGGLLILLGAWWLLGWPRWSPVHLGTPWEIALGEYLTAAGIILALIAAAVSDPQLFTAELRRRLTKAMADSNFWLLVIVAFALIDSLGAGLRAWWRTNPDFGRASTALLVPAGAFLIKKLPDWLGGSTGGAGKIAALVARFLPAIAFLAGLLLYGMVAVLADALLHQAAWGSADAWSIPGPSVDPVSGVRIALWLAALVILVLVILAGQATGFINLSSLHQLYASRLTRAYLGATNEARLAAAANPDRNGAITDNDPADYIQPRIYGSIDLPAPIHIINTTINETVDPTSELVARDRKGDLLSLEPGGVRVRRFSGEVQLYDWTDLGQKKHAESISLGQWCAISGAAASSGMGRLSNLGYALALTFGNVRLGYWWHAPDVCADCPPPRWRYRAAARLFGTFVYLSNELTARYSRGYQRKYLTDGGHFENSGAYALIRRRVPLIVVSDNGADPAYTFGDLQTLIRTVRIDLGVEMRVLGGPDLASFLDAHGCKGAASDRALFVDAEATPDWQAGFADRARADAVLVLDATFTDGAKVHLVWIKPRLFQGMPHDLAGYAGDNPTFPQQTTANQFFDEAQWESYRRLGEASMARLLAICPRLLG